MISDVHETKSIKFYEFLLSVFFFVPLGPRVCSGRWSTQLKCARESEWESLCKRENNFCEGFASCGGSLHSILLPLLLKIRFVEKWNARTLARYIRISPTTFLIHLHSFQTETQFWDSMEAFMRGYRCSWCTYMEEKIFFFTFSRTFRVFLISFSAFHIFSFV